MVLPAWKDLSPSERRSPRKIYERIRAEVNGTEEPEEYVFYPIKVSVKDGNEPIGHTTVTLTDSTDESKTYTGTTGSAGGCTMNNVPAGTYNVTATASDYKDYTSSSPFVVDGAKTLNITMTTSEE